jgi:hypothetical protein
VATNTYTTTYLLASLKRRGMIPSTAGTLTDADFLEMANEELQGATVEALMSLSEEYLVTTKDETIVSGTAAYAIPTRAVDAVLRDVLISDGSSGGYRSLPRIEPEREEEYTNSGGVQGYKVEGNYVVLIPSPTNSGTLRLKYPARPNRLVALTAVREITAINTGTKTVTVAAIPNTFTTSATYDLVKGTPHFDSLAIDQSVTVASGTSITFTNTLPTSLAVGDYVCLAGESPIPQVPVGAHQFLAHRVVFVVQEALGNVVAANRAEASAERIRVALQRKIQPRVPGSARIVINRYGPGMGRGRLWRRR